MIFFFFFFFCLIPLLIISFLVLFCFLEGGISAWYLSPELLEIGEDPQKEGKAIGGEFSLVKCDIYSFGLLVWEVFSRCSFPSLFSEGLGEMEVPFASDRYRQFILGGGRPPLERLPLLSGGGGEDKGKKKEEKEEGDGGGDGEGEREGLGEGDGEGKGEGEVDGDGALGIENTNNNREAMKEIANLIESCWASDPSHRPTTQDVISSLTQIQKKLQQQQRPQQQQEIEVKTLPKVPVARQRLWQRHVLPTTHTREPKVMCMCCVNEDKERVLVWVGCRDGTISVFQHISGSEFVLMAKFLPSQSVPSASSPPSTPPRQFCSTFPPFEGLISLDFPKMNEKQVWGWTEKGDLYAWNAFPTPLPRKFVGGVLSISNIHMDHSFSFRSEVAFEGGLVFSSSPSVSSSSTSEQSTQKQRVVLKSSFSRSIHPPSSLSWKIAGEEGFSFLLSISRSVLSAFLPLSEIMGKKEEEKKISDFRGSVNVVFSPPPGNPHPLVTATLDFLFEKFEETVPPSVFPRFFALSPPIVPPPLPSIPPVCFVSQFGEDSVLCCLRNTSKFWHVSCGKNLGEGGEGNEKIEWNEREGLDMEWGNESFSLVKVAEGEREGKGGKVVLARRDKMFLVDFGRGEREEVKTCCESNLVCLSDVFHEHEEKLIWRLELIVIPTRPYLSFVFFNLLTFSQQW